MTELKPCPYCGGTKLTEHESGPEDKYPKYRSVICGDCLVDWFTFEKDKFDWNSRPIEDGLKKQVDDLTRLNQLLINNCQALLGANKQLVAQFKEKQNG